MHFRSLQVLTAIILTLFLCASTTASYAETEGKPATAGSPYDLIDAVNALRASYGLTPYSISTTLMETAQSHADYMAATGSVSHTGAGGSSVTDRLLAAGYPLAGDLSWGGFRSENITSGSEGKTAAEAVNQWAGDALHLNTMISPNLTEIGAGVSVNGGRVYYVIDCAQPTNSDIPPTAGTSVPGDTTAPLVGDVMIPVVVVTPNADGDLIHEVKAGQTLWQIAISYETKIDEIKRLNNLFDNDTYPGMKLLVKKGIVLSPNLQATLTSTSQPLQTATLDALIATFKSNESSTTPTRSIVGYVIGIVVIALFGGGLFMWLGNTTKE